MTGAASILRAWTAFPLHTFRRCDDIVLADRYPLARNPIHQWKLRLLVHLETLSLQLADGLCRFSFGRHAAFERRRSSMFRHGQLKYTSVALSVKISAFDRLPFKPLHPCPAPRQPSIKLSSRASIILVWASPNELYQDHVFCRSTATRGA